MVYENIIIYEKTITKIVPFIKSEIKKSPDKTIRVRLRDIKKEMGPEFEKKTDTHMLWELKYSLWKYGIFVDNGLDKTGEHMLILRRVSSRDVPITLKDLIEMEKIKTEEGIYYIKKVLANVVTRNIFAVTDRDIKDIITILNITGDFEISVTEISDWQTIKSKEDTYYIKNVVANVVAGSPFDISDSEILDMINTLNMVDGTISVDEIHNWNIAKG